MLVQVFVGDFILNYPVILTSKSNCAGVEKVTIVNHYYSLKRQEITKRCSSEFQNFLTKQVMFFLLLFA